MRSAEPVRRAVVLTHGRSEAAGPAVARVRAVAEAVGVELVSPDDPGASAAGLAVVLGGDGTMLRALARFLGTDVPVIGVNFGRVGFLSSMGPDGLEDGLRRAFAGEVEVLELPTLTLRVDGGEHTAVNDVVITSSTIGRMVELDWAVGGEELGRQPCDGIICSTPLGSTAYNLSNGGPVLVWGLEAMAITFVAPHSLHARPLVLPPGRGLSVENATPSVGATVLVDGHAVGELPPGASAEVRLGERRSRLATLPGVTFFGRYRETFGP